MNTKILELFQTVCFLACMQHGEGLISKHPDYIQQKLRVIKNPLAAWQMLDGECQSEVVKWANAVGFDLAACLTEIYQEVS